MRARRGGPKPVGSVQSWRALAENAPQTHIAWVDESVLGGVAVAWLIGRAVCERG